MPTRRKPELEHHSVEYAKVADRFHKQLQARRAGILNLVGFYREFGDPLDARYTGHTESDELLSELAGLLTTAATIRLDAGFKAPCRLIATLEAIASLPPPTQSSRRPRERSRQPTREMTNRPAPIGSTSMAPWEELMRMR